MDKQLTFIHAADLHLDSPFSGLANVPNAIFQEIRKSTFQAFNHLISLAIEQKVDFVLIVGDLFNNEKQSLKAQIHLRNGFQQLKEHNIPVYLSYGNHDYVKGNKHPITYPENVYIFPDEQVRHFTFEKQGQTLAAIYGFSYENRAIFTNKSKEYKLTNEQVPFHIAMLHGSVETNTEHDTYAPFKLGELIQKNFDYWALGHIHKKEVLKRNPTIVYSGNIQGRNRKETGEKGCYLVTITKTNTNLSFIPLQSLQFNTVIVDASDCEAVHQLEELIIKEITNEFKVASRQLIHLTIKSKNRNLLLWKNENLLDELIEIFNETLTQQSNWFYIYQYSINVCNELSYEVGEHFTGELWRNMEEQSIRPYLNELLHHKEARKYLEVITTEEEADIKQEARDLLFYELFNK